VLFLNVSNCHLLTTLYQLELVVCERSIVAISEHLPRDRRGSGRSPVGWLKLDKAFGFKS
jgi:hypothetical protein